MFDIFMIRYEDMRYVCIVSYLLSHVHVHHMFEHTVGLPELVRFEGRDEKNMADMKENFMRNCTRRSTQ